VNPVINNNCTPKSSHAPRVKTDFPDRFVDEFIRGKTADEQTEQFRMAKNKAEAVRVRIPSSNRKEVEL